MMDYQAIKTEIETDPTTLGLSWAISDAANAALLNERNIDGERSSLDGAEIYNAIVPADFVALSADARQYVRDVFSLGTVDISDGTNARNVLVDAFTGKQTLTNLAALVETTISRAQQLWGQPIRHEDVAGARSLS